MTPPRPSTEGNTPITLGPRYRNALDYAAAVHAGQVRKGSDTPYLAHPVEVAALVLAHGGDEDLVIAALLHDAAEDAGGQERLDDIRLHFGDRVADVVAACSDTLESPKPPWRERKERYLERLDHESEEVLLVTAADKLHNAREMLRDYRDLGESLWSRFQADSEEQFWYLGTVTEILCRRLPGPLTEALAGTLEELRRETGRPVPPAPG